LSRIVAFMTIGSCATYEREDARTVTAGLPSTLSTTPMFPRTAASRLDLPEPMPPTTAQSSPFGISRLMEESVGFSSLPRA